LPALEQHRILTLLPTFLGDLDGTRLTLPLLADSARWHHEAFLFLASA
jgi:hypothetical protein